MNVREKWIIVGPQVWEYRGLQMIAAEMAEAETRKTGRKRRHSEATLHAQQHEVMEVEVYICACVYVCVCVCLFVCFVRKVRG
jgi:hypothetical protein